jgi:hypothetical protein
VVGAERVAAAAAALEVLPPDHVSRMATDHLDAITAEFEEAKTSLEGLVRNGGAP